MNVEQLKQYQLVGQNNFTSFGELEALIIIVRMLLVMNVRRSYLRDLWVDINYLR